MTADNMPRCRTCKHWGRDGDPRDRVRVLGCYRIIGGPAIAQRPLGPSALSAEDCDGDCVDVMTYNDFGCVEHEERGDG